MKVAVFGSAFNPPTLGHKDAIEAVLESSEGFDEVILIPSFKHAFSKQMLDYSTRIQMLELFAKDLDLPNVRPLCIEHKIHGNADKPVYTFDVLCFLQAHYYASAKLSFVIGPDNKKAWSSFYKSDEIAERWRVYCVEQRISVRSTDVREAQRLGSPINHLVSPRVSAFLNENAYYR